MGELNENNKHVIPAKAGIQFSLSKNLDPPLQGASGLASPNRFAGGLCPSRNSCQTLRGDDQLDIFIGNFKLEIK